MAVVAAAAAGPPYGIVAAVGHNDESDAARLPVFVFLPPILMPNLNQTGSCTKYQIQQKLNIYNCLSI